MMIFTSNSIAIILMRMLFHHCRSSRNCLILTFLALGKMVFYNSIIRCDRRACNHRQTQYNPAKARRQKPASKQGLIQYFPMRSGSVSSVSMTRSNSRRSSCSFTSA